MYGNHTLIRATLIAERKTLETGRRHIVMPVEGEEGLYTIGVPIRSLTGDELQARLSGKPVAGKGQPMTLDQIIATGDRAEFKALLTGAADADLTTIWLKAKASKVQDFGDLAKAEMLRRGILKEMTR